MGRRMFEAYVASGAPAQLQVLPPFCVEGHTVVAVGPVELWWPSVESLLSGLRLPTSVMVELPALASIPAPNPLNAARTTYFDYYVVAHTDAKAFAWNAQGHCSLTTPSTKPRKKRCADARTRGRNALSTRWAKR
jgi:hypothetical protein